MSSIFHQNRRLPAVHKKTAGLKQFLFVYRFFNGFSPKLIFSVLKKSIATQKNLENYATVKFYYVALIIFVLVSHLANNYFYSAIFKKT